MFPQAVVAYLAGSGLPPNVAIAGALVAAPLATPFLLAAARDYIKAAQGGASDPLIKLARYLCCIFILFLIIYILFLIYFYYS